MRIKAAVECMEQLQDNARHGQMLTSHQARGKWMIPAYKGLLYVLANNGVLDAYNLRTGEELYRHRLPGS